MLMAKPCPSGKREGIAVAARGLEDHLHVRPRQPRLRAYEAGGLEHVAGQRAAAEQRVFEQVARPTGRGAPRDAVRLAVLHLHQHRHGQVIVVVSPDPGQVLRHRDARRA